jgi:hypothetical protein
VKLKLVSSLALGALVWLALLSPAIHEAPVASADPAGAVDPVKGPITQTFTFYVEGLQPYTQLTLSFLQPGAPAFTIIPTPVPVITDGLGRALIPLGLLSLLDPASVPAGLPGVPITVSWGYAPTSEISFRADACDTVNCVELIGSISLG